MNRGSVVLLSAMLVVGGCASQPLPLDLAEAQKVVAAAVPNGTPVADAKAKMEQRGFQCRIEPAVGSRAAYLSCYTTGHGVMVVRQWGVSFELKDGAVYNPRVSTDLLAP